MPQSSKQAKINTVMTEPPVTAASSETIAQAARKMRDAGIGDVIVLEGSQVCGIVTDRDLVIRGIAEGRQPDETPIADVCSRELTTVTPDDTIDHAVSLMRDRAIRRLPVVEDGRPVGVVSLGDLAVERDPKSALGQISAAPANE
jgi:CBS domain-containing protein